MSRRTVLLALVLLVPQAAPGQEMPSQSVLDARHLRLAGLPVEPDALLALLEPASAGALDRIGLLLRELEVDDYERRHKAAAELVRLGRPARTALDKLLTAGNLDLARQAQMIQDEIDTRLSPATTLAALRTLCRLRYPRAAGLVLEHLPHVGPASHDLLAILLQIDLTTKEADAALRAALADADTGRRAAAGLLLARRGSADQVTAVLPLLEDREAIVRLRTAQGLIGRGDERGFPALIEQLGAPPTLAWQAEELLRWAAAETAPPELLGTGEPATCKPCRDAWAKWLATGRKIDWSARRQAPRRPGLFLTCRGDRLNLVGSDGVVRFSLQNTLGGSFTDAHLLPEGRFLVFDDNEAEVRMCEPSGKVVWQWKATAGEIALTLQPLPAEKRFVVVTDEQIHELSWAGKHLGSLRLGEMFFLDACVLDTGRYATLTDEGFFLVDRANGRILNEIRIPGREGEVDNVDNGKLVPLPEGQVGLASQRLDRILVFDRAGQVLGGPPVRIRSVLGASRYRNGNWVVAQPVASGRLAELTPDGRVIREVLLPSSLGRVRVIHEDLRLGLDDEVAPGFSVDSPEYRIAALQSPDLDLRRRSATLLGQYKEAATQAIPALVEALNTSDATLQTNAARSLALMGPSALPPLLRVLREAPPAVRLSAVRGLGQMRAAAGPAVPDLVAILADANADLELRTAICDSLGLIGPAASIACPVLRTLLPATDAGLRKSAIQALGSVAPSVVENVVENVTALMVVLDHPDDGSVIQAAQALGKFGDKAKPAVPRFIRLLEKNKESADRTATRWVRQAVTAALAEMGPAAAEAVATLAVIARDPNDDPDVRQRSLRTLGRIGAPAAAALPALREALLDSEPNSGVQQELFRTVLALKHNGGIVVLIEVARNGSEAVRYLAVTHLGTLGIEAHAAFEPLNEMKATEKAPRVKLAIQRALSRIRLPPLSLRIGDCGLLVQTNRQQGIADYLDPTPGVRYEEG
jgi:HEAT repeat protein